MVIWYMRMNWCVDNHIVSYIVIRTYTLCLISYYVILLYYIILYYIVLYYIILYYIVLYCIVLLYYIVLCCTLQLQVLHTYYVCSCCISKGDSRDKDLPEGHHQSQGCHLCHLGHHPWQHCHLCHQDECIEFRGDTKALRSRFVKFCEDRTKSKID